MNHMDDIVTGIPDTEKQTILMVDDLPENLEVLMRALKPHFQVRAVRSGKQALRVSQIPPVPDLILLDIMMPGPEDIQNLLSKLLDKETELDIPFILEDIPNLIRDSCEGIDRITKIVQDLKIFSHPGQDSMQLVDINRNLDSTLNIVWNEIKYKATVIKEYGQLPHVNCYPQQINQVFMNLLVNAAQAIVNQGEIRITTRENNGCVEIAITDTGQGIPSDKIEKIFDPFFTTKPIGKGTGLGLNLSYSIIKKHNGAIDVHSELGKGTTFIIRIPVHGLDIPDESDLSDDRVCDDDSL
jgi:signal transduction histidine kinase